MRIVLVVATVLLTQFSLKAQEDVRGTAEVTLKGKEISIEYGRPSLRGRDMLAEAQPGMIWRMGMNTATTMKTDANLQFGGIPIPRGDYKLQLKCVSGTQWELVFNSGEATVPLELEELSSSVETFTISLSSNDNTSAQFSMSWGSKRLKVGFNLKD